MVKLFGQPILNLVRPLQYPKGHSKEGSPLFKRRFIPASLFDNPYLSETGDYEAMLLSLPEHQRKQLLEGNWDINEGAAFPEFDRNTHVVEPFKIPAQLDNVLGRVTMAMVLILVFFGLPLLLMNNL